MEIHPEIETRHFEKAVTERKLDLERKLQPNNVQLLKAFFLGFFVSKNQFLNGNKKHRKNFRLFTSFSLTFTDRLMMM
jgi:hypothetical protein